jgi:hypothetical protein
MRAKESSRTGRVQSTTNDWTFLDPFFAAGAMFDYYYLFIYKYVRMRVFCFMKHGLSAARFFWSFLRARVSEKSRIFSQQKRKGTPWDKKKEKKRKLQPTNRHIVIKKKHKTQTATEEERERER